MYIKTLLTACKGSCLLTSSSLFPQNVSVPSMSITLSVTVSGPGHECQHIMTHFLLLPPQSVMWSFLKLSIRLETFYKATDLRIRKKILHKPAQHSGLTRSFKNNLQLGKGELIKTPSSLCVKLGPVPALWGICVHPQTHGWVQYYGR